MNHEEWLEQEISNLEKHACARERYGAVEDAWMARADIGWLTEIKQMLRSAKVFLLREYDGVTGQREVKIERRGKLGEDSWAVFYDTRCVGRDGTSVFIEPQPSSRTEEYLRNHRWTLKEAWAEAHRLIAEETE